MTGLILENADLNRLFPKCRPKLLSSPSSVGDDDVNHRQAGSSSSSANHTDDMIELERDTTTERCRKRTNGRKKSLSRRQSSLQTAAEASSTIVDLDGSSASLRKQQQQQQAAAAAANSSSSSSASGRSEDAAVQAYGSDGQQAHSQQDDSGTEESPVYILTSAKGDRSYKLRDSRIIEIAGGREVFSQSRGKVAARKPRFLAASNSLTNDDSQSDNKLSLKKNNKSPNRQSVWELRSRCGEARRQRTHREVTETVFSSEVHSVRRNPSKSILDYDSPKSNRSTRQYSYDSILNSNNVEHNVAGPKSITDLEYGLPKNCIDSLAYQSSNHTSSSSAGAAATGMALVSDGEVVVFDDIDDNWTSSLRLDLPNTNAPAPSSIVDHLDLDDDLLLQHQQHQQQQHHHHHQVKSPPEPLSSSLCSSPSPTTTYHRNATDFFKVMTPASDCERDFGSSPTSNHKGTSTTPRLIGELPIAQYTGSPRRYGQHHQQQPPRLPSLLSSPSSVYVAPRPGFPQRVLPTTPSQKEKEDICNEIVVEPTNSVSPVADELAPSSISPINDAPSPLRLDDDDDDGELEEDDEEDDDDEEEEEELGGNVAPVESTALERNNAESPLKPFVLPNDNNLSSLESLGGSTFDYLYEFSETRKVLEEFFKTPSVEKDPAETFPFQDLDYELRRQSGGSAYVGQRLASVPPNTEEVMVHESPKKHKLELSQTEHENNFLDLSVGTGSSEDLGETEVGLQVGHSRNFTLSPETTECDSNCGDLDSEMSLMMMDNELLPSSGLLGSVGDLGNISDSLRIYTSMPVLEDGLSSGHASDTDNNNPTVMLMKRQINEIEKEIIQRTRGDMLGTDSNDNAKDVSLRLQTASSPELFITKKENSYDTTSELQLDGLDPLGTPPPPAPQSRQSEQPAGEVEAAIKDIRMALQRTKTLPVKSPSEEPPEPSVSPIWIPRRRVCPTTTTSATATSTTSNNASAALESASEDSEPAAPAPPPLSTRTSNRGVGVAGLEVVVAASTTTTATATSTTISSSCAQEAEPEEAADEEEADTDLETDRLLGQQRTDDQGFYDDKGWRKPKTRTLLPTTLNSKPSTTKPTTPAKPTSLSLVGGGGHEPLSTSEPSTSNSPKDGIAVAVAAVAKDATAAAATTTAGAASGGTTAEEASPKQKGSSPLQLGKSSSPSSPRSLKEPVSKVKKDKEGKKKRNKEALLDDPTVLIEGVLFRAKYLGSCQLPCEGQPTKTTRMCQAEEAVSRIKSQESSPPSTAAEAKASAHQRPATPDEDECDSTEELMAGESSSSAQQHAASSTPPPTATGTTTTATTCTTSAANLEPSVYRLHYLGSVEVDGESRRRRRKRDKNQMVEEAVRKIKAPEGESQPSTEVDLFISTEKIMVLNTDLKEIMMDHALRTISYIADIGELFVLMARRRFVPHEMDEAPKNRTPKMICHVFESEEAPQIAQSIGQAFQVAYMEFLKANGIEDHSFVKDMDYQEVLNSQEIFGDELQMFAKKEMQKEVVVPKAKGEILGVVIVESGWGSMLPTVVIANLAPSGAAARCGQLNIGDQIIAINGVSLVGLPLSTCQTYIKNSKNQTVVKLTVVPCAPVVEVKIKRPDTKFQLGFSVQNGVICSLLRGGIAERGGVRVGHRIIEINNQSVVAVPHEKIVNLLATSVGEILMKTMPTSMFRLLTGQESPVYI